MPMLFSIHLHIRLHLILVLVRLPRQKVLRRRIVRRCKVRHLHWRLDNRNRRQEPIFELEHWDLGQEDWDRMYRTFLQCHQDCQVGPKDPKDPVDQEDQEYQECQEGDRHLHHQDHLDHQEADPRIPQEEGMMEGGRKTKSTNSPANGR